MKESKWTYDACYEEAKKYKTRTEFKEGKSLAYKIACKNKWLDDFYWLVSPRKPSGYYTYERCYELAKECSSLSEFNKKYPSAYSRCNQMGWMSDFDWLERRTIFTYDIVYKCAKECKTKKEFKEKYPSEYIAANHHKWMNNFNWLKIAKRDSIYTHEKCLELSKLCKSRSEFNKRFYQAYYIAKINNWTDCFEHLENVNLYADCGVDCVYAYVFDSLNAVYVGRCLKRRIHDRHREHSKIDTPDTVQKYCLNNNINLPNMKILVESCSLKDGVYYEDYYINKYREDGYYIINVAKAGSIGAVGCGKYTRKKCMSLAMSCSSVKEFEKKYSGAYAACKNHWYEVIEQVFPNRKRDYTDEEVIFEMMKHETKYDFYKSSPSMYKRARRNNLLTIKQWKSGHKRSGENRTKFTKEYCYNLAKQFEYLIDFINIDNNAYYKARKNGWINDYTWLKRKRSK